MAGKKYLNSNDYILLLWLWKWKLVNLKMVIDRFYGDASTSAAYYHYYNVRKHGLINCHTCGMGRQMMLSLSKKGFKTIEKGLPPLDKEVLRSDKPAHDYLATVFHAGGYGSLVPPGVELVSEQELRTFAQEFLPDWVPETKFRRPDGFTRISTGSSRKIYAHEVELSYKKISSIHTIGCYYHYQSSVDRVFWLVKTKAHGHTLEGHLRGREGKYRQIHNFICYEDFVKNEWNSAIFLGPDVRSTYQSFLYPSAPLSPKKRWTKVNLDMSKTPYKSRRYVPFNMSDFS